MSLTCPASAIKLQQLRYFIAAAEYGSFRKASEILTVRESSVSRAIRDLEARLGTALFERDCRGSALNLAGERFLYQVRSAMLHLSQGTKVLGASGQIESGHIRVGISSSLGSGFLCDLLQAYDAERAGVRIDFSDGYPREHVAAVGRVP